MLKTLQSTLDPTDISDLVFRFRVAHPHVELFAQNLIPEPSDSELAAFVQLYLSSPRAGSKDEAWSLRQRLIAYSLSAIFKDCSIFVKAVLTASGNDIFVLDKEKSKVKLIDFDLKPMRALRKWAELDEKIWRHWMDD